MNPKITTEICIEFARKTPAWENTLPSQWKRRSKKKVNGAIVRTFEVTFQGKPSVMVDIIEKNGVLFVPGAETSQKTIVPNAKPSKKSQFIFAVSHPPAVPNEIPALDGDHENCWYVVISRRSVWEEEHRMDDFADGGEDELDELIDGMELSSVVEGEYETLKTNYETIGDLEAALEEVGILHDDSFQQFIDAPLGSKLALPGNQVDAEAPAEPEFVIKYNGKPASLPKVTAQPPAAPKASLYERLKANPITVDLRIDMDFFYKEILHHFGDDVPRSKSVLAEYTGKVLFCIPDIEGWLTKKIWESEGLSFCCGPQCKDGSMCDSFDAGTYPKLRILFADFPKDNNGYPMMDIGAAENAHGLEYIKDLTVDQAWEIIKERLERSGAIYDPECEAY